MTWSEIVFWACLFLVFYAYVGYGILLFIIVRIKRLFRPEPPLTSPTDNDLPAVTHLIAAYNEERWIVDKIRNSLALDYPADKMELFFVTDGSDDSTPAKIKAYANQHGLTIHLYHQPQRAGKIAAVERVMEFVKTPIVVFSDANTDLNKMAIRNIVKHYQNPKVGAVAGEKRIAQEKTGDATGAGEGLYWKYESTLKKWDAELYSVVGAAGELFSIRTNLYQPVEKDTIIEDFVMTLRIAANGYRVKYAPDAFASEGQSASIKEELKRKIRIGAGGLQAIYRLRKLLNPFKYGVLTFQYVSHRVLRWTLAPVALPILFFLNIYLAAQGNTLYQLLFIAQVIFYTFALLGYILERRKLKFKAFFVPYYFCMMNYAIYRGFGRIISGRQSVLWERAKRA